VKVVLSLPTKYEKLKGWHHALFFSNRELLIRAICLALTKSDNFVALQNTTKLSLLKNGE
jgi:hypothetical protein